MHEHSSIERVVFSFSVSYCIQSAVAEGPNHSPGYLPQRSAPSSTKRCIENGASGKSANKESSRISSSALVPRCQSEVFISKQLFSPGTGHNGEGGY